MIKRSKCIYLIISIMLTFIIQIWCFKYIVADKALMLMSTLLYIICLMVSVESIYLIFKRKNIKENLEMLAIGIIGVVFMIFLCICR